MRTHLVQKALVLHSDGTILLIRRSKTDTRRPLQWDLPGGMCESGEELRAGILREIHEETGLVLGNIHPVYAKTEIRSFDNQSINVIFLFYAAVSPKKDVSLSYEHDSFQWVSLEEALSLVTYELHREVLMHVRTHHIDIAA